MRPKFGTIVLVAFPFTDLTASKVRPALVLSKKMSAQGDIIVCFITSRTGKKFPNAMPLPASPKTGLKVASLARFDKIATLEKSVLLGELGAMPPAAVRKHRKTFLNVFGF